MTYIESSRLINEDRFIPEVVQEILAGNTRRLPLLIDKLNLPAFKKRLETDSALQQVIAKVCADCEQQIKDGNSFALVLQARLYYFGVGYPLDYQKTIYLYERAIPLGHSEAMFGRAVMHYLGRGGPVNLPEAIRLYEQAIQLGNSSAMFNRALMHERGQGGPVNYPEAIRLYEQAIQLGHSSAMTNRAFMHERGQGGPVNLPEAIRLYKQAIQLGNSEAMYYRALMHENGQGGPVNLSEAIRLYEQAIQLGNSNAMNGRALMHEQGQGGPVNLPEAIYLYEQAIQLGNSYAMNNRANLYRFGQDGPVNYPEAIRLYEQAIQLGEHSGFMVNRATMHQNGQGGPVNLPEAIRLYECAARQGNSYALDHLKKTTFNENLAKQLLEIIWRDLVVGQSFTTRTLSALSQYCKSEIINRLKEEPLSTSLTFLKQLKTNPNHPLAFILNDGQLTQAHQTDEFKSLMAQAKTTLDTRITFFNQGTKQETNSGFNRLPLELKMTLFSFVQPNLDADKQENFFLPKLNLF
ncbi:TPR repeat protein [Legionella beliardensis]|uniref:TPR repeat protein n=1 Tax=Legionella beliardensis TaxID=91822 RepID=A0A378JU27_9GAMM|nr:SEL1-like repeat protein [Legionella beliardensis]STX55770.1 TPR repeat protein [Legionella beliardensis]